MCKNIRAYKIQDQMKYSAKLRKFRKCFCKHSQLPSCFRAAVPWMPCYSLPTFQVHFLAPVRCMWKGRAHQAFPYYFRYPGRENTYQEKKHVLHAVEHDLTITPGKKKYIAIVSKCCSCNNSSRSRTNSNNSNNISQSNSSTNNNSNNIRRSRSNSGSSSNFNSSSSSNFNSSSSNMGSSRRASLRELRLASAASSLSTPRSRFTSSATASSSSSVLAPSQDRSLVGKVENRDTIYHAAPKRTLQLATVLLIFPATMEKIATIKSVSDQKPGLGVEG